ncbi:hypothetical protein GWI33_022354 [Rhynchophorus ferrugineus]|uniref:Uncharacterized protein n=1 Tax=Rhynchophorus ferrugineus TaxID=354439 RepID=A0A834HN38_RHYFE|nr:hypothetical protein GWI33_022354 [Rhynchophorus ferrugineus]
MNDVTTLRHTPCTEAFNYTAIFGKRGLGFHSGKNARYGVALEYAREGIRMARLVMENEKRRKERWFQRNSVLAASSLVVILQTV